MAESAVEKNESPNKLGTRNVDGEGSILPFPFKGAVSLGGGCFPLTGLLELTCACSSSNMNTLICVPFIRMVRVPKSRHTICVHEWCTDNAVISVNIHQVEV